MSSGPAPPPIPSRRPPSVQGGRPVLPPRPLVRASSRRKPVPVLSLVEDDPTSNTSSPPAPSPAAPDRFSTLGVAAPSVPPRPYRLTPDRPRSHHDKEGAFITLGDTSCDTAQADGHGQTTRTWYPQTRRGRRRCWIIGAALVLVLVIVIAVVASVLSRRNDADNASSRNTDHGGHPLSVEEGGVDIGQPGDIAIYGSGSSDHFVLQMNRSTLVSRFDPIVSPGQVSSHVHRFYGSSLVDEVRRNASEATALAHCSTTPVQDDHSLYWAPQLYYRSADNGSFALVPIRYYAAYYFQKAPTGQPIYPFPDNYNIVAGDPFRREVDPGDMSQRALWWQCFRGGGNDTTTPGFPETPCPGGLIQLVVMPSCWDGVVAEDARYGGHVTYPLDSPNGNICPDDHPRKLMTVQFETNFAVGDFPFNGPEEVTWVLANGDTSGYGIHADFVNGWKADVQQSIIHKCRYMNKTDEYPTANDIHNCPALVPSIDLGAAARCRSQGQIIDEDVGYEAPLQLLPGCNALWEGIGSKPDCPTGRQEGNEPLEKAEPEAWSREEPYAS